MILTVVVVPDDQKPPAKRAATLSDDRDRQPPKSRPFGVPILPMAVPLGEFTEEAKTDAHADPLVELRARTKSIQLATSNLSSWRATVESDIAGIKSTQVKQGDQLNGQDRELATIKAGVQSTNQMIGHVVSLASGTLTAKHTEDEVKLKLGVAQQEDQFDSQKHKRERKTAAWKTVLQIVGALLTSAFVGHAILKAAGC